MVETIGPTGHTGGRRTTLAACATFLPGALVGGVLTFGALAALGGPRPRRRRADRLPARRRDRARRRGRRGARRPDRAPDPPPAPRALAPRDADAGRRGASTASCSGSASRPSCSASASGRSPGSASRSATRRRGSRSALAFGVGRAIPIVAARAAAGPAGRGPATELMAERPGSTAASGSATRCARAGGRGGAGASDGERRARRGPWPPTRADPSAADVGPRLPAARAQRRPGRDGAGHAASGHAIPRSAAPTSPCSTATRSSCSTATTLRRGRRRSRRPASTPSRSPATGSSTAPPRRGRDVLEAQRITDPRAPGRMAANHLGRRRPSQLGRPALDGERRRLRDREAATRAGSCEHDARLAKGPDKVVVGSRFDAARQPGGRGQAADLRARRAATHDAGDGARGSSAAAAGHPILLTTRAAGSSGRRRSRATAPTSPALTSGGIERIVVR